MAMKKFKIKVVLSMVKAIAKLQPISLGLSLVNSWAIAKSKLSPNLQLEDSIFVISAY